MQTKRMEPYEFDLFAVMASALTLQPLGREPFEHRDRAPEARAAEGPPPRRGLLDRLDRWFWDQEQRAREAYLAESTDIYDLEVRMRHLERGSPGRYY